MGRFVARARVRHDGERYAPGEPIEMDDKAAAPLLAQGTIASAGEAAEAEGPREENGDLTRAAAVRVAELVTAFGDGEFKQDGGVRADALKGLNEALGFEVTAEEVDAIVADGELGDAVEQG